MEEIFQTETAILNSLINNLRQKKKKKQKYEKQTILEKKNSKPIPLINMNKSSYYYYYSLKTYISQTEAYYLEPYGIKAH